MYTKGISIKTHSSELQGQHMSLSLQYATITVSYLHAAEL